MNNKFKEEIVNFCPEIYKTKLKTKFNEIYWQFNKTAYDRVIEDIEMDKSVKQRFIDSSSLIFTGFSYPNVVSAERFYIAFKLMLIIFFTDDYWGMEASAKGFDDLTSVVYGNKSATTPMEIIVTKMIDELKPYYTAKQVQYFRKILKTWYYNSKLEIAGIDVKHASVDTILDRRLEVIGGKPLYAIIELALDIDVSDILSESEKCEQLLNIASKHSVIINDIYSLGKEVAEEDSVQGIYNTVRYMYSKGNDLKTAEKIMTETLIEVEEEFFRRKNELANEYKDNKDFLKFLDELEYMTGCNVIWSIIAPRYNIFNKIPVSVTLTEWYPFVELIDEFDNETFKHKFSVD